MKKWIGILFFVKAFAWEDFIDEQSFDETPFLFVSLGSHCETAVMLRSYEQRRFAFPFDWLVTISSEGMISLLDDDFQYFLDPNFMFTFPNHSECIENFLYELEFKHDGAFLNDLDVFKKAFSKYGRRIDRFRQLRNYTGKVFFVRTAYDLPHCGPTCWLGCKTMKNSFWEKLGGIRNSDFLSKGTSPKQTISSSFEGAFFQRHNCSKECYLKNAVIDSKQASALKDALDRYFPELDYTLIILNYLEDLPFPIEECGKVIEFKVRKNHKHDDYKSVISVLQSGLMYFTAHEGSKTIHR